MFSNANIFLRTFVCIAAIISTAKAITSTYRGLISKSTGGFIAPTFGLYDDKYLTSTPLFKSITNMQSLTPIENAPRVDVLIELVQRGDGETHGYVGTALYKINNNNNKPLVDICGLSIEDAQNLKFSDIKYDITPLTLSHNAEQTLFTKQYHADDSAVYGLVMQFCPTDFSGNATTVDAIAHVTPVQSTGYLSAHGLLSLQFNKFAGYFCGLMVLLWMHYMIKWYNELLPHHWLILFTISFAAVSSGIKYFRLHDMNSHSEPNPYLWMLSSVSDIICSEYTRVIMMFSSLGWGISRPTLNSKHVIAITLIATAHMILGGINAFLDIESILFDQVSLWNLSVKTGLATLDAITFWYVFNNLSNEMQNMRLRKQLLKLSLYQKFSTVLIINCLICFGVAVAEVDCIRSNYFVNPVHWSLLWFFVEGIWKMLFLMTLGSIMYLWRPHENSQKYAYFEELNGCVSDIEQDLDKSVFHLPIDGATMKLPSPKFTIGDCSAVDFAGIDISTDEELFGI